jgi:hypothetical protein
VAKEAQKTTASPEPDANSAPPIDRSVVARRAYDLYEARGRESGHDVEDWLQAERELKEATSPTVH